MTIFADADKCDIDGSLPNLSRHLRNDFARITLTVEQMDARDAHLVYQAFTQVFSETCRVRRWHVEILVEMKHLHVLPVDIGGPGKLLEELKLRCAGGYDNACATANRDGVPDGGRCLLGRGSRQAIFVRRHGQIQLFTSRTSLMEWEQSEQVAPRAKSRREIRYIVAQLNSWRYPAR